MNNGLLAFVQNFQRLENLSLAAAYLDEHRMEIERLLVVPRWWPDEVPRPRTYKDLREELDFSVMVARVILLKEAQEEYSVGMHSGHDRHGSDMIKWVPYARLKVDPDSSLYHVLEILKDLRDVLVHPNVRYHKIECNLKPYEVLKQSLLVASAPERRWIRFAGPENLEEFKADLPDVRGIKSRIISFEDLLRRMILVCVIKYQMLRGSTKPQVRARIKPLEIAYI
jgi:hypothetical protein